MSTRTARTADRSVAEKNAKLLKALLQRPDNKHCADCRRKDPRWASWNIGIFVCIRCSGIHRAMGTHIMKSVDLDSWTVEQVENMVQWGNETANKYWEANLKGGPPSESNIEAWIRTKYENKRWAMKGPIPDPATLRSGDAEVPQTLDTAAVENRSTRAPAKAASESLLNLDDFVSSTQPSSVSGHSSPTPQLRGADLFQSTATALRQSAGSSSAPATPSPHHASAPASSGKPDISSIMSLYQKNPSSTQLDQNGSTRASSAFDLFAGISNVPPMTQSTTGFGNFQGSSAFGNNSDDFGLFASATVPNGGQATGNMPSGSSWGVQEPQYHQPQPTSQAMFMNSSNFSQTPSSLSGMPQGGQFFSSNSSSPAFGASSGHPQRKPATDAFSDIVNFGK
ncbi:hypothetical protein BZG36_03862 [Bifiguratus adelaidae]|uniref:Arf-GAP domain-containing protein n=1 Tax=Bifiguratus adelaidae TaxID=1938954 RepID=A0A261XWH6_9FUNG|nr:hypothetical protein BZG36_03862 [Bifiguratus adelaidae]